MITRYNLYSRVVNGHDELNHEMKNLPSQQFQFESKGLQAHMEYQFWVTASTRVGEGKSSRVVSQIPSAHVPTRMISFGGPIIIPWRLEVTLPCKAVGIPPPTRVWLKGDTPIVHGVSHNVQIQDTEMSITNLQMSDSGNYSCKVDNGIGSDRVIHQLIVQVPPAAPVLYVTSATSSSILMHWKTVNNGNAAIIEYTLHYRRTHGNIEELSLSRHASSHELKGLLCGNPYHIYLTSHNKIGSSPPSTTILVRTQGQAPGVPTGHQLISPNSSSVTIRLHAWPDNGCPILFFVLQYRSITHDGDNQWTLGKFDFSKTMRIEISINFYWFHSFERIKTTTKIYSIKFKSGNTLSN